MHRYFPCLLLSVIFLAFTSCNNGSAELQLKLEEGSSYMYTFTTNQEIGQEIFGQPVGIKQSIGMRMKMSIQEVDESGNFVIESTYENVKFAQQTPQFNIDYDSDDTSGGVPSQVRPFASLLGETFTIVMSPQGKVQELRGYDEMIERVIQKAGSTNDSVNQIVREQIKAQMSDASLKESLENSWNIFPEGAVAEGDSWSKHVGMTGGFPVTMDVVYTLKELNDKRAVLDVKAEIKPSETNKSSDYAINYNLSGKQTGEIVVERSSGLVKEGRIEQDLNGEMMVGDGQYENAKWPVSLKSTTLIESKKLD